MGVCECTSGREGGFNSSFLEQQRPTTKAAPNLALEERFRLSGSEVSPPHAPSLRKRWARPYRTTFAAVAAATAAACFLFFRRPLLLFLLIIGMSATVLILAVAAWAVRVVVVAAAVAAAAAATTTAVVAITRARPFLVVLAVVAIFRAVVVVRHFRCPITVRRRR